MKGDFGISIIGGIDHGFAPYISKTDQNGLRSGDTIVAINNVPGRVLFRIFSFFEKCRIFTVQLQDYLLSLKWSNLI